MNTKILTSEEADHLIHLIREIGKIKMTKSHFEWSMLPSLIVKCEHIPDNPTEFELISFIGSANLVLTPRFTDIPKSDLTKLQELSNYISKLDHKYIYGAREENKPTEPNVDESVKSRVIEVIKDQLGLSLDEIHLDSNIVIDFGADELDLTEIPMALEEEFDVCISEEDENNCHVVKDYIDLINRLRSSHDS